MYNNAYVTIARKSLTFAAQKGYLCPSVCLSM